MTAFLRPQGLPPSLYLGQVLGDFPEGGLGYVLLSRMLKFKSEPDSLLLLVSCLGMNLNPHLHGPCLHTPRISMQEKGFFVVK